MNVLYFKLMDQQQNVSGVPQGNAVPPHLNDNAPSSQNIPGNMLTPPPSQSGNKRMGIRAAIIAAVIILVGGGIFYYAKTRATPPAVAPQEQVQVQAPSLDETLIQAGQKLKTDLALTFSATTTVAGPIVLEENFNQDEINMYGPAGASYLQGLNSGVDIRFSSVVGQNGKPILNSTSSFETDPFFTNKRLDLRNDPIVHYEGRRSITKLSSEQDTAIQRAEGTATIRIPEGLKTKEYTVDELRQTGTPTSTGPISAHLSGEGANTSVDVTTTGDLQNLIDVAMYDAGGVKISNSGYSKLHDGYSLSLDVSRVAKVVVSYAVSITPKTYPFTLEVAPQETMSPASSTGTGGAPASLNAFDTPETRKAILAGLQRTYDVFASKDVQKIRSYAAIVGQADPNIKAKLSSSTDQDILAMAGFITLTPRPDDTYLTLKTWIIRENSASVTVKQKDGSTFTRGSEKINGVWY
jgi:hypothetical protein